MIKKLTVPKLISLLFFLISFLLLAYFSPTAAQTCADLTTSHSSIRCTLSGGPNPTYSCQSSTATSGRCVGTFPNNCAANVQYGTNCTVSGGGQVCTDDYGPHTVSCGGGGGGNPPPPPPGGGPTPTPTPFHLGCSGSNCVRIPGANQGSDTPCGSAQTDAPACTHRACNNGQCILVAGGGSNNCTDDNGGNGEQDCSCPGAAGCSPQPPPPPPPSGCRTSGQTCGAQIGSCCSPLQCQGGNTCQPCRGSGQTCGGGAGACCSGLTCNTTCQGTANPPPPPPVTHLACDACQCRSVSGSGANECSIVGSACPTVPADRAYGAGVNDMTLKADPSSGAPGSSFNMTGTNRFTSGLYSLAIWWNCNHPSSFSTSTIFGQLQTSCPGLPTPSSGCASNNVGYVCVGGPPASYSVPVPAGVYTGYGEAYTPVAVLYQGSNTWLGSRITSVIATCSGPTPTPTPPPGNWIQLRDSSFAGLGSLNNAIPAGIENRYFVTCTTGTTCTTNDPGEVVASTIDLGGAPASPKGWQTTGSAFSPTTSVTSFISYVKARKPYVGPLTSYFSTSTSNTIYYVTGDQVHDVGSGATGQESSITSGDNKIYIIEGNFTINTDFNSIGRSIAVFVRGDLNIDPSVSSINGIFIVQGTINTGTAINSVLTVGGNLISQDSIVNGRSSGSDSAPSLRINFNPRYYLNLLPLISVTTYDWKQLQ